MWTLPAGAAAGILVWFLPIATPWAHAGLAAAAFAVVAALTWLASRWRRDLLLQRAAAHQAAARADAAEAALQKLHDALDELPTAIEVYDAEDRLTYFNRRMQELYGWIDFKGSLGRTFSEILLDSVRQGRVPAAVGREQEWLAERLAKRATRDGPTLQSLRSGHWINTYERRSRSNFVVGVRLEVTDLVQRTRELQDSRERLQAIISNAAVGILSTDTRGVVLEANAAAAALFGQAAESLVGHSLCEWIPEFPLDNPSSAAASHHPGLLGRAGDGSPLQLHVSVARIGAVPAQQLVVVITDLTELARAEQARRVLEAQLREAQKLESIGTLASGIAHDFNNALGSILGNVDLARFDLGGRIDPADEASARALSSLDLVRRAAQRTRHLVRQILTFGRRQPLQRTVQPLQPIVEAALEILRATLPARVAIEPKLLDPEVHVLVDAVQIEQVVLNLCTNAWQAMGADGGRIEVGVERLEASGEEAQRRGLRPGVQARLWVADDGCGMDEATRTRVFDPFFTTKSSGEGTGLGLSVVHGIVKSHEGAIEIASEPGRGTRFDLYFAAEPEPPAGPPGDATGVRGPETTGAGERVLYIDDDEVMATMVERLLQRAGYKVCCIDDPLAAVEALRQRATDFDLVVTDYNMPGLSGLGVIGAVKDIRPLLPVVLISGLVSDDLREQAWRLGVGEVLDKQYTLEQLPSAVARALGATATAGHGA